ncbi:MAG: IclR family transcriptional regulator [Bacillota bacterium]|nr:IclR family transcriptional regulator [Bacillota bacterium]
MHDLYQIKVLGSETMSGVLNKSMMLLSLISPKEEKEDWSTSEISRELNMPVQTVHRLLNCLCEVGFVSQDRETRRFRLSTRIMELGLSIRENISVRKAALPFLIKLSNETKGIVNLSIAEGTEGVIIDSVNAINPIYNFHKDVKGIRLPLSIDAANKVLLANFKLYLKNKIVNDLMNQNVIKDKSELEKELRRIKESGFSITFDEKAEGITSIAAPIFSWENHVVGAISISTNTNLDLNRLNYLVEVILKYSRYISEELGWIKQFNKPVKKLKEDGF